jgi:hypothetical protein
VRGRILILVAALSVTGCSGGAPTPVPTASETPVDHTEQKVVLGEWVLTRTVTKSDDVNNPAHKVGTVSTRLIKFDKVACKEGPCTGTLLSGPTQSVRDTTTFASSGNTITYAFSGFVNCLRQDTGAVLVPNGYSYTAKVSLKVASTDPADDSRAATLEGTMTYTDTLTNEALKAGCSREPVATTTEYALTAVPGGAAPAPTPAP